MDAGQYAVRWYRPSIRHRLQEPSSKGSHRPARPRRQFVVQKPRAEEAEFRHLSLLEPSGFSASSASTPMNRASGEILSGNLAMNRSARHPAVEIDTGVAPRRSPTITAMAEFDIQPVHGPVHHAAPNPDSSPRVDSGQQFLDHLGSSHLRVGQTLWPSRVHKCEPGMIDAQLIEDRGM